jgi:hypothetical protein
VVVLSLAALVGCSGRLDYEPGAYQVNSGPPSGGAAGGAAGGARTPDAGAARTWDAAAASRPQADGGKVWADARAPEADAAGEGDPLADAAPAMDSAEPVAVDAAPPLATGACAGGIEALPLLVQRCGGCHGARMPARGLDLVSPGLALRTVGVASACAGRPLLAAGPGAPTGHLLDKLDGPVPGCGARMPYGVEPFTDDEKACVLEWARRVTAETAYGR